MRLLPPTATAHSAVPTLTPLSATIGDAKKDQEQNRTTAKQHRYPTVTDAPLTKVQSDALAVELNALYKGVMDSLGSDDAKYIQRVYATVVYSELAARGLLAGAGRMASRRAQIATWLLGTSLLSFSKILNNMELGHNVMHGQYDWMQHPHLNSQKFDWDIVCPAPLRHNLFIMRACIIQCMRH